MNTSPLVAFDSITAGGILARAALFVLDNENPAAEAKIQNEINIRQQLLNSARNALGVAADDNSYETLTRIGDIFDDESDSFFGEVNQESVLDSLSKKGELPSDLFDVVIIKNIEDFHGKKFKSEKKLIELTVKSPDKEQNYGEPIGPDEPFLISLFSKYFPNKYPLRGFTLLVAGQRQGLIFVVHQAWRIYPDLVNLEGAGDLVDILEKFSGVFGSEMELEGHKGAFIKSAEIIEGMPFPPPITFRGRNGKVTETTFSYFYQRSPTDKSRKVALLVAIDLEKYREVIRSRGW